MRTLFMKDLRLAGDGLLPWAILLAGLVVFGLPTVRWPESIGLGWTPLDSAGELLMAISILVGVTAPLVAAAVTALVLHGDRRHGAEAAMASMPLAPTRRIGSKALAIVAAATIPVLTVLLLQRIGPALDARVVSDRIEAMAIAVALYGSAIAVGLVLATAPFVRSSMRSLLLALVIGVGGIGVALLAHAIVAESIVAPYRQATLDAYRPLGQSVGHLTPAQERADLEWLHRATRDAASAAALTGLVGIAAAGALFGLVGLARPRRLRWCLAGLALATIVPTVAGAITSSRVLDARVVNANHTIAQSFRVRMATDERIIAAVLQGAPGAAPAAYDPDHWALVAEGRRRVLTLPDAERTAHPIAAAIRQTRDLSTAAHAVRSLQQSVDSLPERLDDALAAAERYPESNQVLFPLTRALWEWLGADRPAPEPTPGSAWERWASRHIELRDLLFAEAAATARHAGQPWHPEVTAIRAKVESLRATPLPEGVEQRGWVERTVATLRHVADLGHPQAERMRALATRIEEAAEPHDQE